MIGKANVSSVFFRKFQIKFCFSNLYSKMFGSFVIAYNFGNFKMYRRINFPVLDKQLTEKKLKKFRAGQFYCTNCIEIDSIKIINGTL